MRFSLLLLLRRLGFTSGFTSGLRAGITTGLAIGLRVALTTILMSNCIMVAQAQSRPPSDYPLPWQANFIKVEQAFASALSSNDLTPLSVYYPRRSAKPERPGVQRVKSKIGQGMGVISLELAVSRAIFVQVPHRFYDKATLRIAAHWFDSGRVKLMMSNSLHRYQGRDSTPAFNSDFSSAPNSPLVAATRSFIRHFNKPLIIQLHGFAKEKRRSARAQQAAVILSHGANLPQRNLSTLNRAAHCIEQQVFAKTLVFPSQVLELGGTKNVIGKQLRKFGYTQSFYHLELSAELRSKLAQDSDLSLRLLACLEGL
jgi:hypothetical protein